MVNYRAWNYALIGKYSDSLDDSEICPDNDGGGELPHYPDWETVNIQSDGGEYYLDVNCVHCGRSGRVARLDDLVTGVNW